MIPCTTLRYHEQAREVLHALRLASCGSVVSREAQQQLSSRRAEGKARNFKEATCLNSGLWDRTGCFETFLARLLLLSWLSSVESWVLQFASMVGRADA